MQILIIGSGSREHALAWKLKQDVNVTKVFVAPGNGGTALEATNIPIEESNIEELVLFAKEHSIDLVIPGPELPLTLGISDAMQAEGIACFGPSKWCAQLEGSKAFAKDIMKRAGIPTAAHSVFSDIEDAKRFVKKIGVPLVVKADGLAAGKGVFIANTEEEAFFALESIMDQKVFGQAGTSVIIEEFLIGEEVSLMAFCSGEEVLPLPSSQDHKAAFDDDKGPNTGGMGAYSPAPLIPDDKVHDMAHKIIRPILVELAKQNHPYVGILYAGLMITEDGPKVLEYNVRFGDPECQILLVRLENSIIPIIQACLEGTLNNTTLQVRSESSLGVVVVAEGYPYIYTKGMLINGMNQVEALPRVKIFQAGTKLEKDKIYAIGGRILCITAYEENLNMAQNKVYLALKDIHIEKSRYRRDIGNKGLKRLYK